MSGKATMQRKTKVLENRNHIPCMHWAKTRKSHTVVQNRFRLSNTAHFCTDCGSIVGILICTYFYPCHYSVITLLVASVSEHCIGSHGYLTRGGLPARSTARIQ